MTARRSITTALTVGVLGIVAPLALSTAAHAELAAPTLTPNPVAQDGDFTVSGAGCIGPDGPGMITLEITHPSGAVDTIEGDPVADNGTWETGVAPQNGTVNAGEYVVNAVCDLYADALEYPSAKLMVKAGVTTPKAMVDDATLVNNQSVTVTVSGFAGNEDLTVVLHSDPVTLGTMRTDLYGNGSATFTIPAGTPAGAHTIVVTNAAGQSVSIPVTVTASGTTVVKVTSGKGGPQLAVTGTETGPYAVLAVALFGAGAAALTLGRRRAA